MGFNHPLLLWPLGYGKPIPCSVPVLRAFTLFIEGYGKPIPCSVPVLRAYTLFIEGLNDL